jgi:hypothetical protein
MKKFLLSSVLALPFLAFANQDASAWHQFKFGVGMNLEGSGGGNSLFWGAWKSQQPPAPGGYGAPFAGPVGHGFGAGFGGPVDAFGGMGYDVGKESLPPTTAEPPAPLPSGVKKAGYWDGYEPMGYYPAPVYGY